MRVSRLTGSPEFGEWLAKKIKEKNVKQKKLAKAVGVTSGGVTGWKGPSYSVPRLEHVISVAEFFDENPATLFRMLGEAGQDYLRRWEKASLPTGQSASRRWKRARHEEAHQKLQQILDDAGSEATVILAVLDALTAVRRADKEAEKKQERSLAN